MISLAAHAPSLKQFLPKSLFGRSLLIIITPLIMLQIVAALIFFQDHWNKLSRRLALDLAGDVAVLVRIVGEPLDTAYRDRLLRAAAASMGIVADFRNGEILEDVSVPGGRGGDAILRQLLEDQLLRPFRIDTREQQGHIVIRVQVEDGVLHLVTTSKRLFTSTTYVFIIWMVGTSMFLLGIATLFMRNQIKPILRLASAAESFGKGRDAPLFKPEGAREVRQAATAFIAMRDRILRQIRQRTAMLAGVSHDLRTPLTRMRLQLEMMGDSADVDALKEDIAEMEQMLEGYLMFARGEGAEMPQPSDLAVLLEEVVRRARRRGAVELTTEGGLVVPVKPVAFQRIVTNLVDNALRFGSNVRVTAGRSGDSVELTVDDDGPGIPAEKREDVLRPFFRLEGSRNPQTGGVGLGLTIASDLVRSHGGNLVLQDSPMGGLRVRIRLPS
jgi:two-component system, OmpR family, osmolarity sensor histidine kinase EnvZ